LVNHLLMTAPIIYDNIRAMKDYRLSEFHSSTHIDFPACLNEQQLAAVTGSEGPCLVLAGAGSGKTRVLIYRLAWLLEKGVAPQNILLVTFTNKAAQEMTHRAESLLKSTLKGLMAGTFHHVANLTLRRESNILGYNPDFSIVDKEDSRDLLADCIEELGITKSDKLFPKKELISSVASLAANTLADIDEVISKRYTHIEDYASQIKRVLNHYQRKKKAAQIMDFDDLLVNWLKVLENEAVRQKYSGQARYILVDEYQDTNRLQFEILKKLAAEHGNILAVGDDAQSIYSFRGAEINNLLDFPKTFPGTKTYKLEINYRSSPQVLTLANSVISHNINQFPKTLHAVKAAGSVPAVIKARDVYQQAKFVGQRILELNREGMPLTEIAVLFRSRYQAMELEVELLKRGVPYILRGGVRFFEQAHIKDCLSYLKVTVNSSDELAFKRALALHPGIGRTYAFKIWEKHTTLKAPADIAGELPRRQQEGYRQFRAVLESLAGIISPEDAVKKVMEHYRQYCYLTFDNPDERLQDLDELAKMAHNYRSVKTFLGDLGGLEEFKGERMTEAGETNEILVLSTIHQAKGLEWSAVFLIGFSDYEFPSPKSLNDERAMEEERRLLYVAATRAKELLYLSYPETKYTQRNGLILSRPSSFYYELPQGCYEEWSVQE